ncbi:MAG TPA: sarcosine oxidase subunit gamma family protein [Steroidobacteraceae bacterium]
MPDLSHSRNAPALVPSALLRTLPPASRFVLRSSRAVMDAAAAAIGLSLPAIACRSAQADPRAALWLGPDEQLLLSTVADGPALATLLEVALAGMPHSLVDVSHRQIALELHGTQAPVALNVGCPLDLDIAAFPVGMCTRTILGKADVVLWRTAAERFHLEVWRSFAQYTSAFLAQASLGLAG